MTIQEERELWRKLAECAIHTANVETEEWLKEKGLYEEYLRGGKECESSRTNSETEKVL